MASGDGGCAVFVRRSSAYRVSPITVLSALWGCSRMKSAASAVLRAASHSLAWERWRGRAEFLFQRVVA